MKKTISFIILAASVLLPWGCESHLDLTPESYITSGSFWKTREDAVGAVNGLYVQMRGDAALNLFIWGEARSEMLERALAGTLGYDKYYDQTLSEANPGPGWANLYSLINQCNLVLKYVPGISFSDASERDRCLAEAYTMRAYAYYTLVRLFGGVPKRLEALETYVPSKIQLPRSSEEEIFSLIKEDIAEAEGLFPDNTIPAGRNHWSLPSLLALKADVYLWTAKLRGGGESDLRTSLAALEAIDGADVDLLDDYESVFRYGNKGNREVLMAVRHYLLESGEQSFAHNMYAANASDYPSYVPQSIKDKIGIVKAGNGNVWRITARVRNQFGKDDSRRDATFIEVTSADGSQYFTNYGMKFRGITELGIRYFLDDWIVYRYADVLLMRAEVKNALGQDPSAEMEKVRRRAYGSSYSSHTFINGTQDVNDTAILQERLFELALEGKRWWDLQRFGQAYKLVPALVGHEESIPLLWPLSLDVLTRETLVTQTEGYATSIRTR